MGEVYIAQDETLERNVALKVLPADLVKNEERVRRFVTEAKSASSLSHPHIVTIYEIGRDEVKSSTQEPSSDPVHYISMELIQGETLQHKIHHEKTDLRTLLGYLAQTAEGLAKAHASGIVHRDLKPSNIMINRDGYAKVLDFGLAKLTERTQSDGEATLAATEVADLTGEGVVLGTVGYMSPEQVRGKVVDHRSDIFSFGCILYEAATRARPFKADSDVETMHQILNVEPLPIDELSPEVPNAVRRLIKRCLAKSPDRRSHSMKDIAIELAEIVEEFDNLAHSSSGSSVSLPPVEQKRSIPLAALLAVAFLGIGGVGVAIWALTRGEAEPGADTSQPFQTMSMTSLLAAEAIGSPVLSADGRYLAYISGTGDAELLWIRQVATGSQVQVAGPEPSIRNLSFSPDGNYLFFGMRDTDTPNYTAIYSIPSLGGTPRKRLFDVDSAVSHSPDGKQACFRRGRPQEDQELLVIADLENGTERIRATIPSTFTVSSPVWSPDGNLIAWPVTSFSGGVKSVVHVYPVEAGDPRILEVGPQLVVGDLDWLPGSDSFVSIMAMIPNGEPQLWMLDAQTGERKRITNDLNRYAYSSVGEGGAAIAALRDTESSKLWTVSIHADAAATRITAGSGSSSQISDLSSLENGDILCQIDDGSMQAIGRIPATGGSPQILSAGGEANFRPVSADGVVAFAKVDESIIPHLWIVSPRGDNARQLTHGDGEIPGPISPDGKFVLYSPITVASDLWIQPISGEEAWRIASGVDAAGSAIFSTDGKFVLTTGLAEYDGRWITHSFVYPVEGGEPVYTVRPPRAGAFNMRWIPGQEALSFQSRGDAGRNNVHRIQLDGTGESSLTDFTDGVIDWHLWSPDGSYLILDRRHGAAVSLWTQQFQDGTASGPAIELANFANGALVNLTWLIGKDTLAFRHVTRTRDIVLVRDFQ